MEKYADYISEIEIKELWLGRKHIRWQLNMDVNVLSGVNGIGKSTILHRIISGVKSIDNVSLADGRENVSIKTFPADANLVRFDIISTPDARNEYDINLFSIVERFDALKNNEACSVLYDIIDHLFQCTGKFVDRSSVCFSLLQYDQTLDLHLLSSGEKHMLCIVLTVFLQNRLPTVLFMDEPEVSLHMEWQQELISTIRDINPNVQIILTTHSPAIIMSGWMDKVTEVSDITVG